MIKYISKKFCYNMMIFISVIFISFFTVKLIPGDPISAIAGLKGGNPAQRKALERDLRLDLPLLKQFTNYLTQIFLHFDFGNSYYNDKLPAVKLFFKAFHNTFKLALLSTLFGSLLGILFGVLSSYWQGKNKKLLLNGFFVFVMSSPTFVIACLMQLYLGKMFHLPRSGFDALQAMILPVLSLSLVVSVSVFKITQTSMKEILEQPYIKSAYAKGLSKNHIMFKYALKNALIPVVAHIGLMFSYLIGGAIITEFVFNIKGIGSLIISSFENRDYLVLQGSIILLALFISLFNLLLDFVYTLLDPRINKKI
ncbi:MAG: ABC transporter permease [Candidatus Phytoplasma pruni]|uniref:ABC transporter permease n=1 Tax=Milkweed yellows phytoplasma TaxID=208434 RepID=UPI000378FBC3|nr:ABC transporter permease [Milkweed yellows phytoplasma]